MQLMSKSNLLYISNGMPTMVYNKVPTFNYNGQPISNPYYFKHCISDIIS